jgi:transcriptional regulator with XRE-family HTH domain
MDRKSELGAFLKSRRAELSPEDAGLHQFGERRRVPGLRREELAQLAGLSITYYTRLEQGRAGNVSASVLDALARALRLDSDERMHLQTLTGRAQDPRRHTRAERPRSSVLALLEQLDTTPAIVHGRRGDVLAWNALGHALYAPDVAFDAPEREATRPNMVQRVFLADYARQLYADRQQKAGDAVAYLRLAAGRYPDDPQMAALIGDLSMKSPEFAALWAGHPVRDCAFATRRFEHPQVGSMVLTEEVLPLSDDPGQRLVLVSAEPGSASAQSLALLATLVATEREERLRACGGDATPRRVASG